MGTISKVCGKIKLYYRYGCRRLGLSSYQIHQIYLPRQKLIYIPIPKNASTSIKQALHEIEFGCLFNADQPEFNDYQEIHEYYQLRPHAFTGVNRLKRKTNVTCFAVIRDPVERLISCYRNRVLDEGCLEENRNEFLHSQLPVEPDLNTFVMNLESYRKVNKNIEHHSRCQFDFLGGRIQYLDRIYTMKEIPELLSFLRKYSPYFATKARKSGGTKISMNELSQEAFKKAVQFYQKDYKLFQDYFSPADI